MNNEFGSGSPGCTSSVETAERNEIRTSVLLCVISWHEKGFWQADVFDTENDAENPEWFCTGKKDEDQFGVINKAVQVFGKKIKIIQGYYGECDQCGAEHIKPNHECDCGGDIIEYA